MLKRLHESSPTTELVTITLEGEQFQVPAGESVLASVMAAGVGHNRTSPISGAKRAGYCQMGVCFECLMEIDGIPKNIKLNIDRFEDAIQNVPERSQCRALGSGRGDQVLHRFPRTRCCATETDKLELP